jgi:hypothetical protein
MATNNSNPEEEKDRAEKHVPMQHQSDYNMQSGPS